MITAFLALALASPAQPAFYDRLDTETGADLACVVLLAFAQGASDAGGDFVTIPADLDDRGRRWSEIVLANVEEQTGLSESEVSDMMDDLVAPEIDRLASGSETRFERQARVDQCLLRLDAGLGAAG